MAELALKCHNLGWNSNGEGSSLANTDTGVRNLGEQTGLETQVVLDVNDVL